MNHHTGVVKIAGSLVNMVGIDNSIKKSLSDVKIVERKISKCYKIKELEERWV